MFKPVDEQGPRELSSNMPLISDGLNARLCARQSKKQQMGSTLRGAHLLLQTRTKVLNDELVDVFRRWYPQFRKKAA